MRKRFRLISALMLLPLYIMAQTNYPLGAYTEPFNPTVTGQAEWEKLDAGLQISWGSRDVHYAQRSVPALNMKTDTTVWAWKGERVSMLAVLFSKDAVPAMKLRVSGTDSLKATANFVNYVNGDEKRNCGTNNMTSALSYVPDVIDNQPTKSLKAMSVTPVWVSVEVPREIAAGQQEIELTVADSATNAVLGTLNLKVQIVDYQLPEPKDYTFNTNFWQQPYAVSRYYGLTRWSQAHFDALRPYLELLARCGQKSVTTILFYEPWGDQSIDKYDAMIRSTKHSDGTWSYDYSVFDHYVELCDSCGINGQINCFSMVPWDMNFRYYDDNGQQQETGKITTDSQEYKDLWTNFLTAFAQHLRDKGWFDKTYIAMDERSLSDMLNAYNILQAAVPGMKMSLAGNYHTQLYDKLQDYCVAWKQRFTSSELSYRQQQGWVTTAYTACPDLAPNLETYNDPADAAYLPLYCLANGFNGFLHWSWMSWVDRSPLTDTRYRLFPAGDYYSIYPGPRSGVRYERYIEGVQQAEKIYILRSLWANNKPRLDSLETQLQKFYSGDLSYANSSSRLVNVIESILNGSPEPTIEPAEDYCTPTLQSANRATAIAQRWLTAATVSGEGVEETVNMTWSVPSTDGYVEAYDTIVLCQGKSVTLSLTGTTQNDGLQWCRVGLFADWDQDRNFGSREDELINQTGNAKTSNNNVLNYSVTLAIPTDAKLGSTRLRAVYNDAWGSEPQPCGELMKGFAIDFPVIITDDFLGIAPAGSFAPVTWTGDTLTAPEKVNIAVYNLDGIILDYAKGVTAYSTAHYTPGTYIIKVTGEKGTLMEKKFRK